MKIVLIRPPEINRVWVGIPRFFNEGIFLFPPLGIMHLKVIHEYCGQGMYYKAGQYKYWVPNQIKMTDYLRYKSWMLK